MVDDVIQIELRCFQFLWSDATSDFLAVLAEKPNFYVTPDDLVDEHVLMHAVPSGHATALSAFMGPALTPARVTQVYWAGAIVEFVKAGLGVGLLAPWSLGHGADSRQLVLCRLGPSGMRRRWVAATLASLQRDANIEAFLKILLAEAPSHRLPQAARKQQRKR
jgi:DNA-binding transcriptional LysR family regulator